MNAVLSTDEEDRLWLELTRFVREGALIPITGSELLEIPSAAGGTKNFYTLVAEELALRLKVDPPQHTGERALNEVACGYLAALPVKLFVTTTFDNLLVRAIEQRHPAWEKMVRQIEYSPVRKGDLENTQLSDGPPVVFHLFGRATSMPEYAVTEEDVLEFMHALQSQEGRPEKLFRLLQQKNLLIVECGFVDWLARFFIRLGVSTRLSAAGGKTDWFIERASSTSEFAVFLDHFGRSTEHFSREPIEFIARFAEKLPRDMTLTPTPRTPVIRRDPARDILEGALFLSYASEDRAIVERIQQTLDHNGIDCWFDRQQLIGGDDWKSKIIRNIKACSLFVPILSRHTLTPQNRFFRREWDEAFKHRIGFAANDRFLIPVAIDDIQPNNPALPREFDKSNWERLPAGEVTPAFRELITAAFQQAQLRDHVKSTPRNPYPQVFRHTPQSRP